MGLESLCYTVEMDSLNTDMRLLVFHGLQRPHASIDKLWEHATMAGDSLETTK